MVTYKIPTFTDGKSNLDFTGAVVFESGGRALLLEETGHIVLCENRVAHRMQRKEIPESLFHILIQRNFIKYPGWNVAFSSRKMPVLPEFFMIDLTDRCSLSCTYCLRKIKNIRSQTETAIPRETLKDICSYITKYCDEMNLPHITVQPWGGEPMIAYDAVISMTEMITPKHTKVHYSMETNGIHLSPEKVAELFSRKVGLSLSLDGDEAAHDAQRVLVNGNGSFSRVLKGLRVSQKFYGDRIGNITTITRNNFARVEEILDYYARELKLIHVKFNFVHKSDFADCEELCLSEQEIADTQMQILDKLVQLHEAGFRLVEENIRTKLNNILFGNSSDLCLSRGCNGGRKMIVFDRKGRIYPCELTDYPEKSLGDIYSGVSLVDMVKDAIKTNPFFQEKREDICLGCSWRLYCQGGCTMHCMSLKKEPSDIDLIECTINRVLYPELVRLILERPDIVNHFLGYNALLQTE